MLDNQYWSVVFTIQNQNLISFEHRELRGTLNSQRKKIKKSRAFLDELCDLFVTFVS